MTIDARKKKKLDLNGCGNVVVRLATKMARRKYIHVYGQNIFGAPAVLNVKKNITIIICLCHFYRYDSYITSYSGLGRSVVSCARLTTRPCHLCRSSAARFSW